MRVLLLLYLVGTWLLSCSAIQPTPLPSVESFSTLLPTLTNTLTPTRVAPSAAFVISSPTATNPPRPAPSSTPTIVARTATPWPQPQGRGSCEEKKFRSAALNQEMPFYLYLPPGYSSAQAQRRYPVLYLLSGLGAQHKEWYNFNLCGVMDDLIANNKAKPMIVVMPSGNDNPAGGVGSYWFNHAPPPVSDGKRWGDYIWQDLVTFIDKNYRTIPARENRAIGGLSAGGQAALMHGLTHPEIFSIVGAHSPSFRHADGVIPYFGDQNYYNQYDPVWLVQNTQTWRQLTLWIDVGDHDDQWGTAILAYHDLLVKLGVPHEFHLFYGFHDPPYWAVHTPDYLQWYASKLTGQ